MFGKKATVSKAEFDKFAEELRDLKKDLIRATIVGGIISRVGPGVVLERSKDEEIRKLIKELFED